MNNTDPIAECLTRIPCSFELVRIAAKRARQLARGAHSELPWGDHKSTVLALQEIAGGQVTESVLAEAELPPPPRAEPQFDMLDATFK